MSEWCKTASLQEQLQQEEAIIQVIHDCNTVLNQIQQYREISEAEILQGFCEE